MMRNGCEIILNFIFFRIYDEWNNIFNCFFFKEKNYLDY